MAIARHDLNLVITAIIFGAPLVVARNFTDIAIIDADSSLDGDTARQYKSVAAAEADNTAGFLSNQALKEIQGKFSQLNVSESIWVANYDSVSENPSDAFTRIVLDGIDVVGVSLVSRDSADIENLSNAVELQSNAAMGKGYICFAQSSDADLLTAGLPAALANLATRNWTALYYHNDDTQPLATSHAAYRMSFDPARFTTPWNGAVRGIAPLSSLTQAQYDALTGNGVNFPAPMGPETTFVSPGVHTNTADKRGVEQLVSALWIADQINVKAIQVIIDAAARPSVIPVDLEGQIIFESAAVRPVLDEAAALNKILGIGESDETFIQRPAISAADLVAKQVPLYVSFKPREGARAFTADIYVGRA